VAGGSARSVSDQLLLIETSAWRLCGRRICKVNGEKVKGDLQDLNFDSARNPCRVAEGSCLSSACILSVCTHFKSMPILATLHPVFW